MIERLAKQVLQSSSAGEILPIDIEAIIKEAGVTVIKASFGPEFNGVYLPLDKPLIIVNDSMAEVRQRFTLAHEYCHHRDYLKSPEATARFYTEDRTFIERRANRFASALLMPREAIKGMRALGYTINAMAQVCNVSEEVIAKRLTELKVA